MYMSNEIKEILIEYPHHSQFKIVLVGDGLTGKTTLASRFTEKPFEREPTAGADITYRKILVRDDKSVTAIIWDLSGQPTFKRVRPVFYKGAHAVCYVYDVTREETLINIANGWYPEIKEYLPDVPAVLIGNKIDLEVERQVSYEYGKKFAEKMNASFFETSALKGIGVFQALVDALRKAIAYRNRTE